MSDIIDAKQPEETNSLEIDAEPVTVEEADAQSEVENPVRKFTIPASYHEVEEDPDRNPGQRDHITEGKGKKLESD